jgi:probable DNA metabolism protein
MITVFVCEDSIEGIFTGVYEAWASKLGHANVELGIESADNLELFKEYVSVRTEIEKAQKVTRTICNRMGMEVYEWICQALLSNGQEKANAVYHTIVAGLQLREGSRVMDYLTCPNVCKVFEYARGTGREAHHYTGFVRFSETFNGVLFSKINPKNNVLTILASYFADRLPLENWIIYDEKRGIFAVHESKKQWAIIFGEHINKEMINNFSESEKEFQKLWKGFRESISIRERENYQLQRQNLPLRFRSNMIEFAE